MAVAREVQKRYPQKRIVVLEKLGHVGGAQTSHNSNVIHAGIYYVPGSVMAETCVKGEQGRQAGLCVLLAAMAQRGFHPAP